jgi:hypothetical protein
VQLRLHPTTRTKGNTVTPTEANWRVIANIETQPATPLDYDGFVGVGAPKPTVVKLNTALYTSNESPQHILSLETEDSVTLLTFEQFASLAEAIVNATIIIERLDEIDTFFLRAAQEGAVTVD